jgi:hypothetical protein
MAESTRIFGDEVEIFLFYKQQLVKGPADFADGRRKNPETQRNHKEGTKLHEGISFVLLGVFFASFVLLDFSFITKGNIYFPFKRSLNLKKTIS